VLEFDHLRDKAFNIGCALPYRNWQSVLDEIESARWSAPTAIRRTMRRMGALRSLLASAENEAQAGDRARTGTLSLEGLRATVTPRPQGGPV
jgi:hypothetical protein